MFENDNNINEFDQMFRSILDEGQEDVPARVWDAVSEGLDKAESRKTVVIWFRRAAASTAAAAAIAAGVLFGGRKETDLVSPAEDTGLIAVVEKDDVTMTEETEIDPEINVVERLVAKAAPSSSIAAVPEQEETMEQMIPQSAAEAMKDSEAITSSPAVETDNHKITSSDRTEAATYFHEDWAEEETVKKREVSFQLSGLTSTNSAQTKNRLGLMKAPTVTAAPQKTGITETSTNTSYGLPLSFGAGVKIGLSRKWSLGVGANYSILTRQFYGKYTKVDEAGNIEKSSSSDIRNTQHYIGLPINAYYSIVNHDRVNFYAYAGGTAEKCIADNYNVLSTSIRHKEKVNGLQLSANAGIGVEFMLGRHLGLYIDPSLRYYFDCHQPKSIRTAQPLMFGFEMGLRARL